MYGSKRGKGCLKQVVYHTAVCKELQQRLERGDTAKTSFIIPQKQTMQETCFLDALLFEVIVFTVQQPRLQYMEHHDTMYQRKIHTATITPNRRTSKEQIY
jgi:hypothetical protein